MLTPRAEALAFRIWRYAEPLGWDCTMGEVAEALGVGVRAVSYVAHAKDWSTRFRVRVCGPFDFVKGAQVHNHNEAMLTGEAGHAITARYARLAEELPE